MPALVTSSSEGRRASWRERAAPISGESTLGVGVAAAASSAAEGASAAAGWMARPLASKPLAGASAAAGEMARPLASKLLGRAGGGGGGGFLGLAASGGAESVGPAESE